MCLRSFKDGSMNLAYCSSRSKRLLSSIVDFSLNYIILLCSGNLYIISQRYRTVNNLDRNSSILCVLKIVLLKYKQEKYFEKKNGLHCMRLQKYCE